MKRPTPGRYPLNWVLNYIDVQATQAEISADLAKIRDAMEPQAGPTKKKATPTTRPEIRVGMFTRVRYKYKGKFHNQVFRCQVVAQTKHGWTVR